MVGVSRNQSDDPFSLFGGERLFAGFNTEFYPFCCNKSTGGEEASNTEPQELLALEVSVITSAWDSLNDSIWKDRVLLTAHPAQGKRCWPLPPPLVYCIADTVMGSTTAAKRGGDRDGSDTRNSLPLVPFKTTQF